MTKSRRIVFPGVGLKILVIHLHQAIAMITDERNANVRIRGQKREEDIAPLKHVPVLKVEKIRAPLETAVTFVNKQIHFIIQDIRFLLMQVPLVMPVTLLSCMACTFKTPNLFVVISRICIMYMYYPPNSVPMPVHIPNVHGSLEGGNWCCRSHNASCSGVF